MYLNLNVHVCFRFSQGLADNTVVCKVSDSYHNNIVFSYYTVTYQCLSCLLTNI